MNDASTEFSDIPQLDFLPEMESEFGLSAGFFRALLNEDDWSFVIKLHALIEASATHLLTEALSDDRLRNTVSRLEMSNLSTGKLGFIKAMDLLDSDSRRFIQKLSELRNSFVHNVGNVNTDIQEYITTLPTSDSNGFHKAFKWGHKNTSTVKIQAEDGQYNLYETIKIIAVITLEHSAYKISIWLGAMIVLHQMFAIVARSQFTREVRDIKEDLAIYIAMHEKDIAKDAEE